MYTLLVPTAEEMLRCGALLGSLLKGGEVFILSGELGAGKTTFVQGVARGMKISGHVTSPSFALIHVHEGALNLIHCDFYRLVDQLEVEGLGFYDYLNTRNVVFIEWGLPFQEVLPGDAVFVSIENCAPGRKLSVALATEQGRQLIEEWIRHANASS
jgi:tRNA threonylcarbamoyladenosine biosynthesis protein TsaE